MSGPNELFIAWLTGSGFGEEDWNGELQIQSQRGLSCPVTQMEEIRSGIS